MCVLALTQAVMLRHPKPDCCKEQQTPDSSYCSQWVLHALNAQHTAVPPGTREEFGKLQLLGMWELQRKNMERRPGDTDLEDLHWALPRALGSGVERRLQQQLLSRFQSATLERQNNRWQERIA